MFRKSRGQRVRRPPGAAEVEDWAAGLAGKKRLRAQVLAANAVLALVVIGASYMHGRHRAEATWQRYDAFSRCAHQHDLRAREARSYPLADPHAPPAARLRMAGDMLVEETRSYATRALMAKVPLDERCGAKLRAVAPSPTLLLLPALKSVERDVREAVRVAALELAVPAESAGLSLRPLRSLAQLRAMLTVYAREAGLGRVPLPPEPSAAPSPLLPMPGRLPLQNGFDAQLWMWGDDKTLHAAALDGTGVSYVRLGERLDHVVRMPRPKLLRDLWVRDQRLWFAWGMPDARCAHDACIGKSTGIAEQKPPLTELPTPHWLAAHVSGRIDRGLSVSDGGLWLLAQTRDGAELRAFARPGQAQDTTPRQALRTLPIEPMLHSQLLHGQGVLSVSRGAGGLELQLRRYDGQIRRVASIAATSDTTWLSACEDGAFALALEGGLALGRMTDQDAELAPVSLALGPLTDAETRSRDRVQLACGSQRLGATALDAQGALHLVTCDGQGCKTTRVAPTATHHAVLATPDGWLIGYAGADPQVRITRCDSRAECGEAVVPAPCWNPAAGMCGAPSLARVGTRILLAARDRAELALLVSPDEGVHWEAPAGLPPATPASLAAEVLRARE